MPTDPVYKTHRYTVRVTIDGVPMYSMPQPARLDGDRLIFANMVNDGLGGVIHWLSTNDPRVTAQGNHYDRYSVELFPGRVPMDTPLP